jgi:hypothetical protein
MTVKTLFFILLDFIIGHMLIKLIFGKDKNLVEDLSSRNVSKKMVGRVIK